MKKICLSLVLSVVSVFSIAAQTVARPNEIPEIKENDKSVSVKASDGVKAAPTSDQAAAAKLQEKEPTEAAEPETKSEASPEAAKKTLGGLSSGNPAVDGYIEEYCALYGVDPLLIYAQMSQESSFNGKAVSRKGAGGFMQLMPDTARRFGVTNVYNARQNIKAGIKYMRWLLDKFGGDTRLALAGYNAGEGAVIKYGNKVPPYRETRNYVARIMSHYDLIAGQASTLAGNDSSPDR